MRRWRLEYPIRDVISSVVKAIKVGRPLAVRYFVTPDGILRTRNARPYTVKCAPSRILWTALLYLFYEPVQYRGDLRPCGAVLRVESVVVVALEDAVTV